MLLWCNGERYLTATTEATSLTWVLYIQQLYILITISNVGTAVIPNHPPTPAIGRGQNNEVHSSSEDVRELEFGAMI